MKKLIFIKKKDVWQYIGILLWIILLTLARRLLLFFCSIEISSLYFCSHNLNSSSLFNVVWQASYEV